MAKRRGKVLRTFMENLFEKPHRFSLRLGTRRGVRIAEPRRQRMGTDDRNLAVLGLLRADTDVNQTSSKRLGIVSVAALNHPPKGFRVE